MAKNGNAIEIVGLKKDIEYLKEGQTRIEKNILDIQEHYLTKEDFNLQFSPIQKWVIGGITLIATAVLGAGVTLVLKQQP